MAMNSSRDEHPDLATICCILGEFSSSPSWTALDVGLTLVVALGGALAFAGGGGGGAFKFERRFGRACEFGGACEFVLRNGMDFLV